MKYLNKEELKKLFYENKSDKVYRKKGTFLFRAADEGETVLTIVSGKLETLKEASENEVIIRNIEIGSSAETYIIAKDVFEKRYTPDTKTSFIDGRVWKRAKAKGEITGFIYHGDPITFAAPWGEEMLCAEGDFIGNPVGGDPDDIYRIEKETFQQTYYELSDKDLQEQSGEGYQTKRNS